jgi:peptide subunit release factor 1 (eRF1)
MAVDIPRVSLSRSALARLLDAIDALPDGDARSLYFAPGQEPPPDPAIQEVLDALGDRPTGAVVFAGEHACLAISPPFPVDAAEAPGYVTAPLRELLARPRDLGVVLVRLGGYSVGVYRDGRFVDTKTGGRFVKNRHRKGGQSQRRFERIREGQIREHFDDVAEAVQSKLLPVAGELDWVVLGGDRHAVQAYLKRAPLPPPLADKVLPRVIDTPEPRRDVLERTPTQIWSSRAAIRRDPRD